MIACFVIGFLLMAGSDSLGRIPSILAHGGEQSVTWLLATAVTATPMRSPPVHLIEIDGRSFIVIFAATTMTFTLVLVTTVWSIS